MPIYEYRCERCGQNVEALQKMSDAPLKVCKHCGEEALQRVMSRTSFVLKGSGWYATDYKSPSGSGTTSSAPAPSPAPSESSAPKATESKPAATSDSGPKTS